MGLTADGVADKTFSASPFFGRGYDVSEVDDFLDEVVLELKSFEGRGARSAMISAGTGPLSDADLDAIADAPDRVHVDDVLRLVNEVLRARAGRS